MSERHYTIGEIARRCGLSVRTVRYYADIGLLAPVRTEAGYRVFDDADVVALDLVRALRAAGASLATIAEVRAGQADLSAVLGARLDEVEASIGAQRRVAASLRSALGRPEPSIADLRRVSDMIDLSHAERRATVSAFFKTITGGVHHDPLWKDVMIERMAPELPDDATPDQIDAWLELNALLEDESLQRALRAQAVDTGRTLGFLRVRDERDVYVARNRAIMEKAAAAMARGVAPDAPEAEALADAYIALAAWNRGVEDNAEFRAYLWVMWAEIESLAAFWRLVDRLNGHPSSETPEWRWLERATQRRLAPDGA